MTRQHLNIILDGCERGHLHPLARQAVLDYVDELLVLGVERAIRNVQPTLELTIAGEGKP